MKNKSQDLEIIYRGEVWNSSIVRISASAPHPVDENLTKIQKKCHLERGSNQVEDKEECCGNGVDLDCEDDEDEEDMTGEEEAEEDPGRHAMRLSSSSTTLGTWSQVTTQH